MTVANDCPAFAYQPADHTTPVFSVDIVGHGMYWATPEAFAITSQMARKLLLDRIRDTWDGESDGPEIISSYKTMPTLILAVVVGEWTSPYADDMNLPRGTKTAVANR